MFTEWKVSGFSVKKVSENLFFWSLFSPNWTEKRDVQRKDVPENMDQKSSEYGCFLYVYVFCSEFYNF